MFRYSTQTCLEENGTMWRQALTVAALVWLGWPLEMWAQLSDWGGPSFDCDRASQPLELLICSDPELIRLDRELGVRFADHLRDFKNKAQAQRFLADQREWLPTRMAACGPAEQLQQEDAACVAGIYRERLAALGAPADVVGRNLDLPLPDGMLHPLCMDKIAGWAWSDEESNVAIEVCNRSYRHIPFDSLNPSVNRALHGWFRYQIVGVLEDGRDLVWIEDNPGGTGTFEAIFAVTRRLSKKVGHTMASAEPIAAWGDRCNGEITNAELVKDKLLIDRHITPVDLFGALGMEETPDRVPYCAICCIGTSRGEVNISSKKERLVAITLTDESMLSDFAKDNESVSESSRRLVCLSKALLAHIDSAARDADLVTEGEVTIPAYDIDKIAFSCP